MTLPIARDLAAAGIRVNTIAPGLIDTPIYGEGEASEQFKAHLGKSVLFPPRLGSGEELAFSMVVELHHQPVHECRDHPRRWRHSHASEMREVRLLASLAAADSSHVDSPETTGDQS